MAVLPMTDWTPDQAEHLGRLCADLVNADAANDRDLVSLLWAELVALPTASDTHEQACGTAATARRALAFTIQEHRNLVAGETN